MSAALDHLVYATPDLAGTTAAISAALGVTPDVGGRHIGRGTANTLIGLGNGAYLEIIGPDPDQPTPSRPRPFGVDELTSARLVTFAIRVQSMPEAIESARRHGYDPGEALAMQRATPDGGVLSWTLTDVTTWADGVAPFLVDWLDSTHPSTTINAHADLVELRLTHPLAPSIEHALAAIGFAMPVQQRPIAGITAVIECPTGSVTLEGTPT